MRLPSTTTPFAARRARPPDAQPGARPDYRWLTGIALLQLAALGSIAVACVTLLGNGRMTSAILIGIVAIWAAQIASLAAVMRRRAGRCV